MMDASHLGMQFACRLEILGAERDVRRARSQTFHALMHANDLYLKWIGFAAQEDDIPIGGGLLTHNDHTESLSIEVNRAIYIGHHDTAVEVAI